MHPRAFPAPVVITAMLVLQVVRTPQPRVQWVLTPVAPPRAILVVWANTTNSRGNRDKPLAQIVRRVNHSR